MSMKEWVRYYENTDHRVSTFSVTNLEFTSTRLETYVEQPEVVCMVLGCTTLRLESSGLIKHRLVWILLLYITCTIVHMVRNGGGNSTSTEEVSKFQCLFHDPQLVDARKGIQPPKSQSNTTV